MIILIKSIVILFLLAWSALGIWIVAQAEFVSGQHKNAPHESPGARALSVAQVSSIWFGFFVLAIYFLFL